MAAVHFQIHGEHLTEISRARVIEDRWDHGYRILHEGLHGISIEQCMSILKGDAKLTGVNTVNLEPDDAVDHKRLLQYRFGGTWVTSSGRHLRPYAIVTSWGPDDISFASQITRDSDSQWNKKITGGEMAGRDLFYANDPKLDAVKNLRIPNDMFPDVARGKDDTVSILFEPVDSHPDMIVPAFHRAQEALDDFLKNRGLTERGYAQRFPPDRYQVRYEVKSKADPVPELVRSHERLNEYSQTDERAIGAHRAKMIDVAKSKLTLEEYDAYWATINNQDSPLKSRTDAFFKQLGMQKDFDLSYPIWREQILEQNGDDFIPFEWNGKSYPIPRKPFLNWALWRTDGAHLAPPWKMVSPQGVKMMGDDAYHTDWMLGAGFDPDAMMRDRALNDAIFNLHFEIQNKLLGFEAQVLSGKGDAYGQIVHHNLGVPGPSDILIIPNASPRHLPAALKAKAVITQQGGAVAHLVNVAREHEKIVVRVPDALTRYPHGSSVTIDCASGEVKLWPGDMKAIWEQSRT